MTKEELKKEAEENSFRYTLDKPWACEVERKQIMAHFEKGYLAGAEPREKQIQIDAEQIRALQRQNGELTDEVRKLKVLVSSLVYEINQIWDINEMNDDLRVCAEKIDREVQLSKMTEDNRIVISALGFAIVPPKPKLNMKEIKEND